MGGGGLSQVSVCRVRGARPEGGARQGHYVIHGERLRDQKVSHPGALGQGGLGGAGEGGWECRREVRPDQFLGQNQSGRVGRDLGALSTLWVRAEVSGGGFGRCCPPPSSTGPFCSLPCPICSPGTWLLQCRPNPTLLCSGPSWGSILLGGSQSVCPTFLEAVGGRRSRGFQWGWRSYT